MRRYEALELQWNGKYVIVFTVDNQIVERIAALVGRYVGGEVAVHKIGPRHRLHRLNSKDHEVFYWLKNMLCRNGWEPYAVSSHVFADGGRSETHYFRREIQDSAGE